MATSDPLDKKLLKLKKKLKQIETLEERENKGEKMEENQVYSWRNVCGFVEC